MLLAVTVSSFADTWTVAGSMAVFGSDWGQADTNNDMTSTDGTVYTLVKNSVFLIGGKTYEYKVVKNHDWNNGSYPGSNRPFSVEATGTYNVTITFNTSNNSVSESCAVVENHNDVTSQYLQNASLTSLTGWDYGDAFGDETYNYTDWKTDGGVPVIEFYHTFSSTGAGLPIGTTKNFHFTQTVTLPAGNYRIAVNAFYREGNGDGTNTKAYIFAGDKTQYVHALTADEQNDINGTSGIYSGPSDLYRAAYAFSKGDFSNAFDFNLDSEQEITLGFRGSIDTYCSWCILGPVKLYKYTIDDLLNEYRAKVYEAENLYTKPMNATVLAELQAAVVDEATLTSPVLVGQAEAALSAAISKAKASVYAYSRLNDAINKAKAYAVKCYANGAPESNALNAIETAYNERTVLDSEVDAKIAEINDIMMAIGLSQTSWPRLEPVLPGVKALESGKIYYLYNVGSDRFLTNNGSSYYYDVYALTNSGTPVKISAVNGTEYTIQFTNNSRFLESYYNSSSDITQESTSNPSSDYYRFTFTETEGGYMIQRVLNSVENEYLGYNGNEYNRPNSNLTEGNTVWQLFDADEAARFIAKRNLYRALVSADSYWIDQWEFVYDNEGSSNYALQDAADELNSGMNYTNKYTRPDWADYNLLFYNGNLSNNWYEPSSNYNYLQSKYITNGSLTLKANVEVDDDATLVFSYWAYNGYLEVYLDDELQQTVNWQESESGQRYFVEMTPGKHHITWKFINTNKANDGYCTIYDIGVEQTPTINVSLLEPGSLGSEVLAQTDHVKNVRKLIVSGEMNDADWAQILNMNSIFSLDLTNVTNTEIPEKALSRDYHSDNLLFLHKVKLPTTLKTVGNFAFQSTYLDEMSFPDGLETIGYNAFYNTRIKEAILPASLIKLNDDNGGSYAFANNQSLEIVSLPASVVTIPGGTFYACNNLQSFQIPEGITTIGESAFLGCWYFNSDIPTTVTSIGRRAFDNTGMTNVVIQENVSIGDEAFQNCGSLTSIVLPTTFYDDIYRMLAYCDNLRDVTFKSPTMVLKGDNIFSGNTLSNITLHVPNYLVNTYKLDNYWYNCNVVGFSTLDIQDWFVRQPLKMIAGQRFEGTPNVKLMGAGRWEIKGDDAMTLNNLETDYNNNYRGFQEGWTTQILSTCDNIQITGDFNQWYHTTPNQWFFVTLPFDTKVGDINSSSSFAVRYYDGANRAENGYGGNWKNYAKDDVIPAGTGFIFQTSQDVWSSFKAQDNESKQRVFSNEMITTNLQVNASAQKEHKGWNLVGNPWMTYYNIHKMNFTAPITCWDPYYYTYTAYSVYDDDYAIKPLEAFFVQCPSDEMTTIEFPVDGRQLNNVIESQNAARVSQPSERKLIDVELTDGEMKDKTRFVMNPQASMDYELDCDASKFMSMDANAPQIYTIENGVQLSINERPMGDGTVKLGIKVAKDGTYTISAPRNGFKNIVLVDNATGIETDLSTSEGYTFSADKGISDSRFVLRVGGVVVTSIDEELVMKSEESATAPCYNLNGQRITAPQKGLYIVNGKKVMK